LIAFDSVKPRIITTIPRNGERFILETLESLRRQTLVPDRIVVLDDGSTDRTEDIVESFRGIPWEWRPGTKKYGLFGNFNRCLEYAAHADYLHILHQDDTIEPEFYAVMTGLLADCDGRGMAWCLDERIDENGARLSMSGKPDGAMLQLAMDDFLKQKAEIGNQAFCATLLKTARLPSPCSFPTDMPILGDMIFWAEYGKHCEKLVHVRRPLAKYRWHGDNATNAADPLVKAIVHDVWRTL
jgi:glycosyltransferase involved in cell wall biosynthesis